MKSRKPTRCYSIAIAAAIILAAPTPSLAQDDTRIEALETQMNDLMKSQAKILELLTEKKEQAAAPSSPAVESAGAAPNEAPSPVSATETPAAADVRTVQKGAAILDVWLVANGSEPREVVQSDLSVGRMLDKGPFFQTASLKSDPALASYADKPLAMRWTGWLNVRKAGRQLLVCDWTTAEDDSATRGATVVVSIGGEDLITLTRGFEGKLESATATTDLMPGNYEYSITYLTGLGATSGTWIQKLTDKLTLKMRAQDDLSPRTLGAEDFSVGR